MLSPDQDSRFHDDNGEGCALTLGPVALIQSPRALYFFQERGSVLSPSSMIRNSVNFIRIIVVSEAIRTLAHDPIDTETQNLPHTVQIS